MNNSNKPLVSILCITYNHEKYIHDAIKGFLMQKTNFPIEIIIADDASTDGNQEIIKNYQAKYPELIKPILRKKNIGVNLNWLDAAQKCKGKYIALCEGDDYWTDPYKLQKQVDFLKKNKEYILCYHNFRVKPARRNFRIQKNYNHKFTYRDTLKIKQGPTLSMVFRNILQEYQLPKNFSKLITGDWGLELFLLLHGKGFYFKEKMGVYRIHENGITQHPKFAIKALRGKKQFVKTLILKYPEKIFTLSEFLLKTWKTHLRKKLT